MVKKIQGIYDKMLITREKFKSQKNSLYLQSCPCDPHSNPKKVENVMSQRSFFHQTEIRNNQELSGEALIFIHRMLKNKIKSSEYFLFSEAVLKNR